MPYERPIYRKFGDVLIATSHATGRWVWASGPSFPDATMPRPHDGAAFFRTDLTAWYAWDESTATWTAIGGGGAPTDAEYIVAAAHIDLTAERVLTDTASVTWDFGTPGQAKATATVPPGSGTVPVGGIIMWSGAIATIPVPDWQLCDGTLNAPGPDLRDKFVVGATQDNGGVAKTNIEGSLKQTGGVTGHSHSGHANLVHAGLTIGDHTGLTHGLTIANHPDLTHAALSHAASTITHADHSVPSFSHTHGQKTVTIADHSIASFSATHSHASTAGVASFATSTNRSGITAVASHSGTHSYPAVTLTHAAPIVGSYTGTDAAITLTHADHSFPSLSHQAIGTHFGTDYGVHTFTAPAAHGAAGTLTHSFNEPNDHAISAHDTVLSIPNYYALAFIQRML